jgi:outer membrane receptor protein involved in Fe transport
MPEKFFILMSAILLIAAAMFGQTGLTGTINGTVLGPDEIPLPGVKVVLESPALVLPELTTITNINGVYRFPGLEPGQFQLTFTMEGMNRAVRKGIIVNAGKTSTIDIRMTLKRLEERIDVSARAPTIDRRHNAGLTSLDARTLEAVPSPGRTAMDYFNLAPGITGNTAHGSGQMENSYNLDGVNMGDPVTGTEYVSFAMDIMEEVSIQSGGLSAEYGSVKGGVLNVVTKSGGNTLSGSAAFYFDHEKLQGDNTGGTDLYDPDYPEKTGRKFQIEPALSLGGPVIKNKLWFFGSLGMISRQDYVPGYPHDRAQAIPVDQKEYFPYIKFTYQPSQSDKFIVSYSYSDLTSNHRDANRFYNEATTRTQESPTHLFRAHWTKTFGANFYASLKAAFIKSNINFHAKSPGVQYHDWVTGFQTGTNWRTRDDSKRDRYQVNLDATTFIDNLAGSHELKIGGELQVAKTGWLLETTPDPWTGFVWRFDWPEYLGGTGIYYGFHIKSFDRKEDMLNYSFFLNDTWRMSKNLTVNIGLRCDYNSITWPAQNQDEIPIFNPWGILVDRRIFESITPLKWQTLSPRLGLIYDIFADGTTLFKVSWSNYVLPNTTQWVNEAHPNGWYYWMDIYNGYTFVQLSQGLVIPGGTSVGYGDYDLTAPTADELTVGIEREIWDDWSLGVRYIKKWDKNLLHTVDAASLDIDALMETGELKWIDWQEKQVVDPYDNSTVTFYDNLRPTRLPERYLVNPPGAERSYDGLEITINKRYSQGWSLNASYVYANARGMIGLNRDDVDGAQSLGTSNLWANPNAHINAEGRFPYERRHQFKVIGLVKGPWGINIGGYFRRLSGQRWTRAITSNYLGLQLKQVTETIKAEERGASGYPALNLLDLKVEKVFKVGRVYLKLFADIFNVLNADTVIQEYLDSSDPYRDFREDLDIVAPRILRLGARIEF